MKKKFLSMMLFGLVALGMTTTFQSCKNYDSDLEETDAAIVALTAKVTALETELKADLANKAETSTVSSLSSKLAQTELDVYHVSQELESYEGSNDAKLKTLEEELVKQVTALKELIASNTKSITELQAKYDKLNEVYTQFFAMVVGIDVYTNSDWNAALGFTYVAEQSNEFGKGYTDKTITTTKGQYVTYGDSVLVRVNPTIANLANYKDSITLVNSQGADLSKFVEVTDVHQYAGALLSKSATTNNSGLWVVTYSLKKDYDAAAFKKAISVDGEALIPGSGNMVLFAVAVKDGANDRYIVSDYDVTVSAAAGTQASNYFTVNKIGITNIHNRYSAAEDGTATTTIPEYTWDTTTKTDVPAAPAVKPTIVLASGSKTNVVTAKSNVYGRETTTAGLIDNRQSADKLNVAVGEDITIDMSKTSTNADQKIKGFYVMLDYAYAVESAPSELNAWNSYSYEGVGKQKADGTVISKAKMFEGTTGTIKITSLAADVKGDVIGFRVFAINLDGTLTDPDGQAFYVKVGESESGDVTLATTDMTYDKAATNQFVAYVPLNGAFNLSTYTNISVSGATTVASTATAISTVNADKEDADNVTGVFNIAFVKADKTTAVAANSEDAAYAKVLFNAVPNTYIDGATYNFTLNLEKQETGVATKTMRKVTFAVTKKMPTATHELTFLDGHSIDTYVGTTNDWTNTSNLKVHTAASTETINQTCKVNFQEIYYDSTLKGKLATWATASATAPFWSEFSIANTAKKADESLTDIAASQYVWHNYVSSGATAIASKTLVDGTTTYAVNTKYSYGLISKAYNATSKAYEQKAYVVEGTAPSIKMHSWIEKLATEFVPVGSGVATKPTSGEYVTIGTTYYPIKAIEIAWNESTAANLQIAFANLYAAIDATNAGVSSNLFSVVRDYVAINGAAVAVTSESGQVSNYFTANALAWESSCIQLVNAGAAKGPDADVKQYITFKVQDAFGHDVTVKIPFTVKK